MGLLLATGSATVNAQSANAGFKKELKKRKVPESDFSALPDFDWKGEQHTGLKYYDNVEGSGKEVEAGDSLKVHYECKYLGVTAVSSREGRLLGGNRTIAEPFSFTYGKVPKEFLKDTRYDFFVGVGMKVSRDSEDGIYYVEKVTTGTPAESVGIERNDKLLAVDGEPTLDLNPAQVGKALQGDEGTTVTVSVQKPGATNIETFELKRAKYGVKAGFGSGFAAPIEGGGLYAGPNTGPRPPAALYLALDGMKKGGKRTVIVPADVGYGDDGANEIPPGGQFKMEVEVLELL